MRTVRITLAVVVEDDEVIDEERSFKVGRRFIVTKGMPNAFEDRAVRRSIAEMLPTAYMEIDKRLVKP